MKNILIAETDRIGDVVLSLPVFKSIKQAHSRIILTALVRKYTEGIFRNFPYVDKVISFSDLSIRSERERLREEIRERNFDAALMLHPEYKMARIIYQTGIQKRISYGWKWYQYLFSQVQIQHRSQNTRHQLEYNLELLKLINIHKKRTDIVLKPVKEDLNFIHKILKEQKLLKKKLIGLHPGSGHSSLNLPPDKYIELIEKIRRNFKDCEILLTGNEKEKSLIEHIAYNTKVSLHPMPLNLSLSHLIALISRMNVFISNSTGPMHIASALRTPVVAFFSPVFVHSPMRWGPYWGKRLVVKPEVECREYWKCRMKHCLWYNCFQNLDFRNVIDFIRTVK